MLSITEPWRNIGWLLVPEQPLSPAVNVALDEVLVTRVAEGLRGPTLRFWGWAAPAVILGRFQSVRNEVDEEAARRMGVTVVRRISGGGAMFVQPDRTITYSLTLPEVFAQGVTLRDSYEALDRWAVEALRAIGVEASYAPLNDIACSQGKIGGAAQARRRRVILHHTTIAYELDNEEMRQVLRIGRERLSDRGTPSAAKHVHPLLRQTDLPRPAIVAHLIEGFRRRFGLAPGPLTPEELAAAETLAQDRYATEAWTYDLP